MKSFVGLLLVATGVLAGCTSSERKLEDSSLPITPTDAPEASANEQLPAVSPPSLSLDQAGKLPRQVAETQSTLLLELTQLPSESDAEQGDGLLWGLRRRVLAEEISALGNQHPWAGHYASASTTDTYIAVTVAPRAGYTKELVGWKSNVFESGRVRSDGDKITLVPTYYHEESALPLMSREVLRPIRWGDYRFLLESDDLLRFCDAVNSGDPVGSYFLFGAFLMRDRQWSFLDGRPEVRPELPAEFERFVFDEPLKTRVVRVLTDRSTPTVLLDIGTSQGVFESMTLFGSSTDFGMLTVTRVFETSCEASFFNPPRFEEQLVGALVSSRRPVPEASKAK